jgi:hypothetical protein
MSDATARIIGIPWYRREDYAAVRSAMADRHVLASSYDQWLAAAQNNESVAQQAGLRVVRAVIEPEAFARWCAEKNLSLNGQARTQFAQEVARSSDP